MCIPLMSGLKTFYHLRIHFYNALQTCPLTLTPVTVPQYKAFWLQRRFSDVPINLSYSKTCSVTVTQYGAFWLQRHFSPSSRGCHCKRAGLYYLTSYHPHSAITAYQNAKYSKKQPTDASHSEAQNVIEITTG